jgi:hypothetical protein
MPETDRLGNVLKMEHNSIPREYCNLKAGETEVGLGPHGEGQEGWTVEMVCQGARLAMSRLERQYCCFTVKIW